MEENQVSGSGLNWEASIFRHCPRNGLVDAKIAGGDGFCQLIFSLFVVQVAKDCADRAASWANTHN